ncbi:TMEM175 family protein [Emticicia sp. SJ17W-69]|uniref:TMEM175 family protein n=1 Tax=Emticicia sp. SJ17W-69 TaxID=3421657 RepID=UPI003EC0E562
MNKSRVEAFSDGVIAIIITIMVLGFSVPKGETLIALLPLFSNFLTYALSFFYVGIYWANHHHLWQAAEKVTGKVLWANLHLLFWLSMLPVATSWMGASHFRPISVAFYGLILLITSIAWYILVYFVKSEAGKDSIIYKAFQKDNKIKTSIFIYGFATCLSFIMPYLSVVIYLIVALLWVIPDKRIEKHFYQ